ncbi:hypothetical protein NLJ89_g6350 [Agrocybe chaxingu]|uniref:Uncharacterized protein n=1 Tax=Agrocybe chaxingu TaxID=84603 RepID=A0A9W8MWH3_9AGAR|nr:hypothetical protein NLJ89_g6350 [Agrocybe chaxingu]
MSSSSSQPVASTSKRTLSVDRQLGADGSFTPTEFNGSDSDGYMSDDEKENNASFEKFVMGPVGAPGLRFPLRKYLSEAAFPDFGSPTRPPLLYLKTVPRAAQWPKFRHLVMPAGTRTLKEVVHFQSWALNFQIKEMLADYNAAKLALEAPLPGEPMSLEFRLPFDRIVDFEPRDLAFLDNIRNEDDMFILFKRYILDTASETCRFMHRAPPKSPLAESFKFHPANRLCPAHHARWDIYAMGPQHEWSTSIPLIVIYVPPWEFGTEDFKQLVALQKFDHGILDVLDRKTYVASDVLWAIAYEALRSGKGHKFVFTNYVHWAFGFFDNDYTQAIISDVREARLIDAHGRLAPMGPQKGHSVLEMLIFWMEYKHWVKFGPSL